jgi:hypothetical protein
MASDGVQSPWARSYSNGRSDGRSLKDWLSDVVHQVVTTIDPLEVIVFGSTAVTTIYRGLRCGAPVDVVVSDPDEIARDRHRVGSVLLPALRQGPSLYRRPSPV